MSMPPSPAAPRSAVTRSVGGSFTSCAPHDAEPARAPWFAGGLRAHPLVELDTVRENIFRLVLPNLKADPCPVGGWRLLRAIGGTCTWIDLPAEGDGLAMLGASSECDLILTDDPCIAQRHLAAVVVRSRKEAPLPDQILLMDLQTGVPMFLDDDMPRYAAVDAALSVRVGHHVLYAYPVGPTNATNDAPEGQALDAAVVSSAPNAPDVSCPQSSPRAAAGGPPLRVRLAVERRGMGASVDLPLETLDDGIILGRGLDCLDAGLHRVLDHNAISRRHLLLLRVWDELLAFDLCSTNGTRVAGRRIRRHRIGTADTLELGRKVTLNVMCLEG